MFSATFPAQRLLTGIFLMLAFALAFTGRAEAGLSDYPFRLETSKTARAFEMVAHNEGPATITVYLTISGENIASDVTWPVVKTLKPFASETVAKVFPQESGKSVRLRYTHSFQYGDYRAAHSADAKYRLPYPDGKAYRITQAYGDRLTSHIGFHSQHAVDFATPEGTPIVAARDGVIIESTLQYEAGGVLMDLQDKANHIAIQHADGTVAHYGHLAKRAPVVRVGERVAAGTVIGYAGNTGYSSGPHLHFEVSKPDVQADGRLISVALPIKFYVDTWTLPFEPRKGAVITASYSNEGAMRASASLPAEAVQTSAAADKPVNSVIPLREAPATVGRAAQPQPEPPQQVAAVSFDTGVVPMQRARDVPAVQPVVVPQPQRQPQPKLPVYSAPVQLEEAGWSFFDRALAALALTLVLLFTAYFRRQQ